MWVPCTVCPDWGGPDGSLWFPWVCCGRSRLGCLRFGWYVTSWLGRGALFPVESVTAVVRENISSALMMMSPSVSQSDPEKRAGLSNMTSRGSTWNVSNSYLLFRSHRRSICPNGFSSWASP